MRRGVMVLGLGAATLGALLTPHALAQTELATGPFTANQIEAGRKVYTARCASCQ